VPPFHCHCRAKCDISLPCNVTCSLCNVTFQMQMQRRDERTWLLRDLLAAAKEAPISQHTQDIDGTHIMAPITRPCPPTLKGKSTIMDLATKEGLPKWMSIDQRRSLFRAIRSATAGESPTLVWKTPISVATQLEMTIVDAQQMHGTPRHLVKVILRSRPQFQGRWYLHVTFVYN
jgi:hypothetical protein